MAEPLLTEFLRRQADPHRFSHADHLCVAFELLQRGSSMTAAAALSAGLKSMAARAGKPGAYHETITLAFVALIAERRAEGLYDSAEQFLRANQDLLDKSIITRWYDPARLRRDIARECFILPEPVR